MRVSATSASDFIAGRPWRADEASVLARRNHELDREALETALQTHGAGYIEMIGSRRKARQVFEQYHARGVSETFWPKFTRRLFWTSGPIPC